MSVNSTNIQNAQIEQNKSNMPAELATSLAFSGVLSGGFGSLSAITRNKGVKSALEATKLNNQVINNFLNKNNVITDGFTKSYAAAKNYEALISAQKTAAKAAKKAQKLAKNGDKLTLWQKIVNFRRNDADVIQGIKDAQKATKSSLENVEKKLAKGVDLTDVTKLGLKQNAKNLFKEEILNPFNILFVAMSAFSRIKNEAIPVFKEQGFCAGMKKMASVAFKTGADTVSNAGFSAVFRLLGSNIGLIAGPCGAAVGGFIGDVAGSFFSSKFITKLFGEDKVAQNKNDEQQEQQPKLSEQTSIYEQKQAQIAAAKKAGYSDEQIARALQKLEQKSKMQGYYA